MPSDVSYTPEEVAQILKISRFTVYELIKRGDLAAYRIGRKVRVEPSDLDRYKQNAKGCPPALNRTTVENPELNSAPEGLIICGQDPILDALARQMERRLPNLRLLRRYLNSTEGLMALYHGTANIATVHLWDGDTNEYNLPYVRRLVPGQATLIFNLVFRTEGFYVQSGNPKNILGWEDLNRTDIRFINRECGSGARVLLDEQLRKSRIDPRPIQGYRLEETSHLAVASRIARDDADVGLGIEKVARQVEEIDFVPLIRERYDLVIRKEDYDLPHFRTLIELLRAKSFQDEVAGMGGYDVSRMGQLISEI